MPVRTAGVPGGELGRERVDPRPLLLAPRVRRAERVEPGPLPMQPVAQRVARRGFGRVAIAGGVLPNGPAGDRTPAGNAPPSGT